MLRTNLSTRPFYNERGVRSLLGLFVALAVGLTLFNVYEILRLRGQSRDARQTIVQNDAQARDMRDRAAAIRRSIDRAKLEAVQLAALEANSLIDRRTFSWTELLNEFQTTLPPDVRIHGVRPQVDSEGRRLVQISVSSRRIEDLEAFMTALEKTGAFSGVLPRSDRPQDDGTLRSELQAYYTPVATSKPPAAASDSGKESLNQSAAASAGGGGPR